MALESYETQRFTQDGGEPGAASRRDASDGLVGARLGNYVIERPLARGGMGTVYVARHLSLDRLVAVKVLSDDFNDCPELASRFKEEARVTANLRHPHIVEIFDFGTIDGHYYYVMELLQGQDLSTYLLGKGHLPVRLVVRCVQQICSALSAVHAAGVVHRDLKPGNVFVVDESPLRLKLVDFGIAKVTTRGKHHTNYGQVIGSPSHMAPEQALGYTDKITPQSDLYSLGALAYEMLTGRPVFQHESEVMLLMMHIREPFVPIRELVPHVPQAVAAVIECCLAKDAAQRPASARVIMEELARATGEGTHLLRAVSMEPVAPAVGPPPSPLAVPVTEAPAAEERAAEPRDANEPPLLTCDQPLALETAAPPSEPPLGIRRATSSSASPSAGRAPSTEPLVTPDSELVDSEPPELTPSEVETLGRLLRRMQLKGDFPAFVRNVGEVSKRADANGTYSARQLGDAILKDCALTARLLRTVNQSYSSRFGGKVFSVKHAIVLLGFDRVRTIAMSISLFKTATNRARAKRATDSAISAIVTGEIARSLAGRARVADAEYATICGMFRNLGHHLAVVYLPDEYDRLLELRETEGVTLDAAARRVLGVSLRRLGIGIAELWRLPQRMVTAIATRSSPGMPLVREDDRLGALADFSASLCNIVVSQSPGTWDRALAELLCAHRELVHLDATEVPELLRTVQQSIAGRYSSLGLETDLNRFSHNVNTLPPVAPRTSERATELGGRVKARPQTSLSGENRQGIPAPNEDAPRLGSPVVLPLQIAKSMAEVVIREASGGAARGAPPTAMTRAAFDDGAEELARLLDGGTTRHRVLVMSLELLSRYLDLPRIIALVADSGHAELSVRAAIGEDADALRTELTFPLRPRRSSGDMFTSAYHNARDVIVEDTFAPSARCLIPARYYEAIGSPCFVLLSCSVRGRTKVLLLADRDGQPLPAPALLSTLGAHRTLIVRAAR